MRFRGVHHVEFSVINYDESIRFYDKLFGWLGYKSFWTLDVEYRSTYYVAGLYPFIHSYIGIQPAANDERIDYEKHRTGIHHLALWAKRRKEVDAFYEDFLLPEGITVTDPPAEYPYYVPGYYAVCFLDPTGIRWELAFTPRLPGLKSILNTFGALKEMRPKYPQLEGNPLKKALRKLPGKHFIKEKQNPNSPT